MKVCSSCQAAYEPYGQKCSLCRECKKAYDRAYHARRSDKSKARKLEVQKAARARNAQYVYDYLAANSCTVCGESRVPCLQFDHLRDKTENISNMVNGYSLDRIKEEIAKCRVLCANCHAVHTASQFNWYSGINRD